MKFIDFFSGIGGFRLGMEMAGHECVGHCEIDKYADKSYRAMHKVKESEWFADDITGVQPGDLPEADIYCGGFPCQSFSIAGKRGGFADTRGTLFFEVMRLAAIRKPKYLFLENVRGLLSHDGGQTFGTIISAMGELGYDAEWQIINSKDYVPQNRERIFIIGCLRGSGGGEVFPIRQSGKEVVERQSGLPLQIASTLCAGDHKISRGMNLIAQPVLTPDRGEKRQNGRRFKNDGEDMFTLTAQDKHGVLVKSATTKGYEEATDGDSINLSFPDSETRRGRVGKGVAQTLETSCNQGVVIPKERMFRQAFETMRENDCEPGDTINPYNKTVDKTGLSPTLTTRPEGFKTAILPITKDYRIRRLTPKECFRLQGFPDEYFERAAKVNSDSQLYKQAGNSVTVPVIYDIARRLK